MERQFKIQTDTKHSDGNKKFKLTISPAKVTLKVPKNLTQWLIADLVLHAKKIAELINSPVSLCGSQDVTDFSYIILISDSGKRGAKVTTKRGYDVEYFTPKGTSKCKHTPTTQLAN